MTLTSVVVLTPNVAKADGQSYGWTLPYLVGDLSNIAMNPDVAWGYTVGAYKVDQSAMVVWIDQAPGSINLVWSRRWDPQFGWQTPMALPGSDGVSSGVRVISPDGNIFFAFYVYDRHVVMNWYHPWYGWTGRAQIEDVGAGTYWDTAMNIDVATDNNGKIAVSWIEYIDGGASDAYMKVIDTRPGNWWGMEGEEKLDAFPIQSRSIEITGGVPVAIGSNGVVIAVWSQWDGTRYGIYSNRLEGGLLQGVQTVDSGLDSNAFFPDVAMNSDNDAVCVYRHYVGGVYSIYSAKWLAGSGPDWGACDQIENSDETATRPSVTMNANGQAIAVWVQKTSATGFNGVYFNRYDRALPTGFDRNAAELISHPTHWKDVVNGPEVAVDIEGNAAVVWGQWEGDYVIDAMVRTYSWSGDYWGSCDILDSSNWGHTGVMAIAPHKDEVRRYMAVWEQDYYNNVIGGTSSTIMAAEARQWPSLLLSTPADGTTTSIPVVEVSGQIYPSSTVSVNGMAVTPWVDGHFTVKVPLMEGANAITVNGMTATGVIYSETRWVTYNNPIPDMLADIAQLFSDMSALGGEVDVLQTDVTALQSDLAALETDLSALEADVATIESQLIAMQSDISALEGAIADAQDEIDALAADMTAAEGSIASMDAELSAAQAQINALEASLADAWDELNTTKDELDTTKQDLTDTQAEVSDLPSQTFVLTGMIIVAVVLALLLALMYVSLKRSIGKIGK